MNQEVNIYLKNNEHICIDGNIDFNNVVKLRELGIELMSSISSALIDLKGVKQSDSSSLALLVSWIRVAKSQNKTIKIINIPSFIISVARVSGVDKILFKID